MFFHILFHSLRVLSGPSPELSSAAGRRRGPSRWLPRQAAHSRGRRRGTNTENKCNQHRSRESGSPRGLPGEGISANAPAIPPRTGGKMTGRWGGSTCPLTKVVVVHHGVGRPQPGPLLGEVVAEFQKCCVFFQHAHDLHFHFVAQGLALWSRKNKSYHSFHSGGT